MLAHSSARRSVPISSATMAGTAWHAKLGRSSRQSSMLDAHGAGFAVGEATRLGSAATRARLATTGRRLRLTGLAAQMASRARIRCSRTQQWWCDTRTQRKREGDQCVSMIAWECVVRYPRVRCATPLSPKVLGACRRVDLLQRGGAQLGRWENGARAAAPPRWLESEVSPLLHCKTRGLLHGL